RRLREGAETASAGSRPRAVVLPSRSRSHEDPFPPRTLGGASRLCVEPVVGAVELRQFGGRLVDEQIEHAVRVLWRWCCELVGHVRRLGGSRPPGAVLRGGSR